DFTLATMPLRFAETGDRHAAIDEHPCSIERVLELSAQQEREGLGDAPWPPNYKKQPGEPARVQPSRRRGANRGAGVCPSTRWSRSAVPRGKRMRSPVSSDGRRATLRPPRIWSRRTC